MSQRNVRIGIDVGGTFTKAVVIDDNAEEIIGDIALVTDRKLYTCHTFLKNNELTAEEARRAIEELLGRSARVIVASDSFSVDDARNGRVIMEEAAGPWRQGAERRGTGLAWVHSPRVDTPRLAAGRLHSVAEVQL